MLELVSAQKPSFRNHDSSSVLVTDVKQIILNLAHSKDALRELRSNTLPENSRALLALAVQEVLGIGSPQGSKNNIEYPNRLLKVAGTNDPGSCLQLLLYRVDYFNQELCDLLLQLWAREPSLEQIHNDELKLAAKTFIDEVVAFPPQCADASRSLLEGTPPRLAAKVIRSQEDLRPKLTENLLGPLSCHDRVKYSANSRPNLRQGYYTQRIRQDPVILDH